MLRIRLARTGKKKQPSFRVVVADIEAPRDGRIVERIGHYMPLTEPAEYEINEERALYWLSVGAQPTDTVRSLLRKQGTLHRLRRLRSGESLESLLAEYAGQVEAAGAEAVGDEEVDAEAVAEAADVVAQASAEAVEEE